MNHEIQIEWREPADEEIRRLTADQPDDRHGDPDEDYEWFCAYRDHPGGIIFGESEYVTPSAWSTGSDKDLRAAWHALTGRQLMGNPADGAER